MNQDIESTLKRLSKEVQQLDTGNISKKGWSLPSINLNLNSHYLYYGAIAIGVFVALFLLFRLDKWIKQKRQPTDDEKARIHINY